MTWDDATAPTVFTVGFNNNVFFNSITICDTNGNSITYQRGDGNLQQFISGYHEWTWTLQNKPAWIDTGVTITVALDGQCCENRIPNCSEQSKFTGMGKTRNANGELVGPGNVKNRTCVSRRCQCPDCP